MADRNFVSYRVTELDLPYVRVHVHGMGRDAVAIADGAVPWHASAHMRKVAAELIQAADELDQIHPRPEAAR